jgi:hypothetical protein
MKLGQFKIWGMEQRDHSGPVACINQSYLIALTVLVEDCNTEEQIWKWDFFNFQKLWPNCTSNDIGKMNKFGNGMFLTLKVVAKVYFK